MGFFDNVGNAITRIGNSIGGQANSTLQNNRLSTEIRDLQKQIWDIFAQIGEASYSAYRNQTQPDLGGYFSQVQALEAQIVERQQRMNEIAAQIRCPNCGKNVSPEQAFCPNCGMPMQPVKPMQQGQPPMQQSQPAGQQGQPAAQEAQQTGADPDPRHPDLARSAEGAVCPNCGEPIVPGASFCKKCGARLTD